MKLLSVIASINIIQRQKMMKIKVKKEKKRFESKTQPDQSTCDIRASLGEQAKQKLREISCISNNLVMSRSRDWTLEETYQPIHCQSFQKRYYETVSHKNDHPNIFERERNISRRLKEVERIKRLNKTEESVRATDQTDRKQCSSINLDFEVVSKEKEARIHSNGQLNIDFDNSSFNLTEKALKEAANKLHTQFSKTYNIFHSKSAKPANNKNRTPLPHRKLAVKNIAQVSRLPLQESQKKLSEIPMISKQLAKKRQFLDLSLFLMEEKKSIFYPMKVCLSLNSRAKSRGVA